MFQHIYQGEWIAAMKVVQYESGFSCVSRFEVTPVFFYLTTLIITVSFP